VRLTGGRGKKVPRANRAEMIIDALWGGFDMLEKSAQSNNEFEREWNCWIEKHRSESSPERLRRLGESMHLEKKFVENIWWPAFRTLEHLYPEYEVKDYNDGRRFIDLAYKPERIRIGFEADGFFAHIKNIDRWEYADNQLRDMHLIADGWTIVHLSYDIIMYRPRQAQQLVRQIVWSREGRPVASNLSPAEREAVRYGRNGGPVSPAALAAHLGICSKTARKLLRQLAMKQIFRPARTDWKIAKYYVLTQKGMDIWLDR